MGRKKRFQNRKEYMKWYYLNKIKPFRKDVYKGKPEDIYQCPLCGFYNRIKRITSKTIFNGIFVRAGRNHSRPEQLPQNIALLVYEKQRELFKSLAQKSFRFLNVCLHNNLITINDIKEYFGLKSEKEYIYIDTKNIKPRYSFRPRPIAKTKEVYSPEYLSKGDLYG